MDESLTELIFRVFAALIFISAITTFLILDNKNQATSQAVLKGICNPYAISENITGNTENYMSGAQIVYEIKNGLETDITIDGLYIPKTVDTYYFDFNSINPSNKYSISYSINTAGVIQKVIYTKI